MSNQFLLNINRSSNTRVVIIDINTKDMYCNSIIMLRSTTYSFKTESTIKTILDNPTPSTFIDSNVILDNGYMYYYKLTDMMGNIKSNILVVTKNSVV